MKNRAGFSVWGGHALEGSKRADAPKGFRKFPTTAARATLAIQLEMANANNVPIPDDDFLEMLAR